jgi:hypothetical protein
MSERQNADDATEFSIEYDAGPKIRVKHRASGHVYQFTISDSGEGLASNYFIAPNFSSHVPPSDLSVRAKRLTSEFMTRRKNAALNGVQIGRYQPMTRLLDIARL